MGNNIPGCLLINSLTFEFNTEINLDAGLTLELMFKEDIL